jgi:phosphoglycolate phosphatase
MFQSAKVRTDSRRQAVIFDFDGTIADSFEYVFNFLKSEADNTKKYSDTELKELRSMSMRQLAITVGVPVWRLPLTYFKGRRVMRARMDSVQPFEGIVDVIRKLYEDDYLLFIASSNSGRNIRHLLRRQGILSCFRAIRSGAGITGKPALIRQLMVRYRLSRQSTWYVGDELTDMISAKRAKVHSLPVDWGFADSERLIQIQDTPLAMKPADIIKIIES